MDEMARAFPAMHENAGSLPTEGIFLLAQEFVTDLFSRGSRVFWLGVRKTDMASSNTDFPIRVSIWPKNEPNTTPIRTDLEWSRRSEAANRQEAGLVLHRSSIGA